MHRLIGGACIHSTKLILLELKTGYGYCHMVSIVLGILIHLDRQIHFLHTNSTYFGCMYMLNAYH